MVRTGSPRLRNGVGFSRGCKVLAPHLFSFDNNRADAFIEQSPGGHPPQPCFVLAIALQGAASIGGSLLQIIGHDRRCSVALDALLSGRLSATVNGQWRAGARRVPGVVRGSRSVRVESRSSGLLAAMGHLRDTRLCSVAGGPFLLQSWWQLSCWLVRPPRALPTPYGDTVLLVLLHMYLSSMTNPMQMWRIVGGLVVSLQGDSSRRPGKPSREGGGRI